MSKGPAYAGGSKIDTVSVTRFGDMLTKQCVVPDWYTPELLHAYAGRLLDHHVISYRYDSIEKFNDRLTVVRPYVVGIPLLDSPNLSTLAPQFPSFVARLVSACAQGDVCIIPTEVSELHNVIVSEDGTLNLVDIETSFIVACDLGKGYRYLDTVYTAMIAEFNRVVLLEQIEKDCC